MPYLGAPYVGPVLVPYMHALSRCPICARRVACLTNPLLWHHVSTQDKATVCCRGPKASDGWYLNTAPATQDLQASPPDSPGQQQENKPLLDLLLTVLQQTVQSEEQDYASPRYSPQHMILIPKVVQQCSPGQHLNSQSA